MKKTTLGLFLLLLLVSCGDDALIGNDTPTLSQQIFILPSGIPFENRFYYKVSDSVFLDLGQTYKFYATYGADEKSSAGDSIYSASLLWDIDGQYYNIGTFQHLFEESGEKKCYLQSIDFLGDTLHTEFSLFINTPNKINLAYPSNNDNQVDGQDKRGVNLKWTIAGIDPWETTTCTIFASDNEKDIWESPLGQVDCLDDVYLKNITDNDKKSETVYWAVQMQVKTPNGKISKESSKVFRFSTSIPGSSKSYLTIPFLYEKIHPELKTALEIILVSAQGDTLKKLESTETSSSVRTALQPQTGLKIFINETLQQEYTANSLTLDIPQHTEVIADTVKLSDNIKPQLAPFQKKFAPGDSIQMLLYDDGSGINADKIKVIENADTLNFHYRMPTLAFVSKCKKNCRLQVTGEDYAKNSIPGVYWNIENQNDTLYLSGPFLKEAR